MYSNFTYFPVLPQASLLRGNPVELQSKELGLQRTGISAKEQIKLVEEEDAAEESDGDEMGVEFIRKPELHGGPVIFQNLSGVHWGYEETKTFLDIFHETRFYEAPQACHRKSKLYGAMAEQLRECGFL
ncbi:unnamed protein product [Rangifer tarandus platyrhynchus]|uniref:Uncharacterized protein n=1 Tax=Rangifer tarandus platyrhynchus TaxID=3082113 RepID=A0AC59ZX61_RANTA